MITDDTNKKVKTSMTYFKRCVIAIENIRRAGPRITACNQYTKRFEKVIIDLSENDHITNKDILQKNCKEIPKLKWSVSRSLE